VFVLVWRNLGEKIMKQLFNILTLVLFTVIAFGCGNNVRVRGKVVYSDDGSPITCGQICFVNDKTLARGDIKEDGTFQMGSNGTADGLLPGEYTVYFSGVTKYVGVNADSEEPLRIPLLAENFNSPELSEMKINVTGSTKWLEIKVDRAPK
jgi:hypothetical protein